MHRRESGRCSDAAELLLKKLDQLTQRLADVIHLYENRAKYRQRLIVSKGVSNWSIPVPKVAFICSHLKMNFVVDFSGDKYFVNATLIELERQLGSST
jgi:hypothetical protein